MQMPNVFVHPPEEDQEEPYCCFDAANPSTSYSSFPQLEILHPYDNPPSSTTHSVIDAYHDNHDAHQQRYQDDDDDDDLEHGLHNHSHYFDDRLRRFPPQPSPPEEDSEVIEVVRVRKSKSRSNQDTCIQQYPHSAPLKRSSSFKSKASKAFRSFTGSLRGSKVPRTPELPQHVQYEQESVPTPTISRRGSLILSQLFSTNPPSSTSLKSRTSMSSFNPPSDPSPTDQISSPTSSTFSVSPTDTVISPPSSRRSSLYAETIPPEIPQLRSPSPALSTASRRKFSGLNLRKMFSFSSASTSTSSSGRTTPTLSSSGPQTPTSADSSDSPNDITPRASRISPGHPPAVASLGAPVDVDFGLPGSSSCSQDTTSRPIPSDPDVSFEMRLDSLHFDDLSFDADKFAIS